MIQATSLGVPYQVTFTNGRVTATADVPPEKGGGGQGFGPHELVEAALATCLAMTVEMHAAKHGLPVRGVTAEVRLDRSRPGDARLDYALTIDGPLTAEQREQLLAAARECPVGRTLAGRITCRPADGGGGSGPARD
jgi:putative redox protein